MKAVHDRGYTLWRKAVKRTKRTKKDFNEHYDFLTCICYTDRKVQNTLADTPTRRDDHEWEKREGNDWGSLTPQEQRFYGKRKRNLKEAMSEMT